MAQVPGSLAPPWPDLPPEPLGLVFLRLPTLVDRALFLAVCRMWRSAARQCHLPPPSPMPWLLLPDGSATSFPHGETFQLLDGMRYHNSCGEWILESRNDNNCFLTNHFTKVTIPLPSLSSYSYYSEPVEVPEDYMDLDYDLSGTWLDNKGRGKISVLSLVVCSTRLIAVILAVGDLGTIALCRPGAAAWSVSAHEQCRFLSHMVFFQGKLYALNDNMGLDDLIAIDIVDENDNDEPRVSRIECLIEGNDFPNRKHSYCLHYLVESRGTLLMIRRIFSYESQDGILVAGSIEFEVLEANFEQHLWAVVKTLGNDQALFLGQGSSRAVQVSPYDLSRNCIFFMDDCTNLLAESCGVYDLKDEKVYSPLPMVSWKSGKASTTWIFSQGETDKLQNGRGGLTGDCGTWGGSSDAASTLLSRAMKKE